MIMEIFKIIKLLKYFFLLNNTNYNYYILDLISKK